MATSLLDNLIAYYSFDTSSNIDTSWNGNNISNTDYNTANAQYGSGIISSSSKSLRYQSSSPRSAFTSINPIPLNVSKSYAIAFWFNTSNTTPGTQMFFNLVGGAGVTTNAYSGPSIGVIKANTDPFSVSGYVSAPVVNTLYFINDISDTSNGVVYYNAGVGGGISTNTNYFVVAQYTRGSTGKGTVNLSVNNGVVYSRAIVGQLPQSSSTNNIDLMDDQSGGYLPSGSAIINIDEVMIWQRSLSTSEITTLYNSGNGLVYPYGNSGSLNALYAKHKGPANTRRLHNLGYF
jgi:hypothetical protein